MANRLVKAISQVGTKRRAGFTQDRKSKQSVKKSGIFKNLSKAEVSSLLDICDNNGVSRLPTIELEDATMKDTFDGDVCLIQESPYRILKLGSSGNLAEIEKIYKQTPTRLNITDTKGRSLLHVAAAKGKTPVLDFALTHGLDLNCKDDGGNTPLHAAAEAGSKGAVAFLLSKNADSSLRNNSQATALHVAVEKDHVDVVATMGSWTVVNINIEGENGSTPLHYAAHLDRDKCAKVLLQNGALLCKPCHIGLYPMHVAAQHGSSKTLQVMIEYAEKHGMSKKSVLNHLNQEQNTALHAAVNGGDIKAVEMCLNAGSDMTETTGDKSTAVHLAAANGSIDVLHRMIEKDKTKFLTCINAKDIVGRQPLHIAALYDRADVMTLFMDHGASVNSTDDEQLTPLLLAATKKAWNAVELLLKGKPNLRNKDMKGRNILHLIIMNGGSLDNLSLCLCNAVLAELLNMPDDFGSIPLHYACREGLVCAIESMLKMGALLNAKNKEKQSPLHFAARYGRFNTCKRLLATGPNSINDTDGEGQTALHGAAANGHTRVVTLLLQRGATPFRDLHGNTPVHLASSAGYTHSMKILLDIHSHLINASNKVGDTPLHLAAQNGHSNAVTMLLTLGAKVTQNANEHYFLDLAIQNEHKEVCVALVSHDRWREVISCKSATYGCALAGFIKYMPSVCQMVLDRCRTPSNHERNAKKFHYKYDFSLLQCLRHRDLDSDEKKEENKIKERDKYKKDQAVGEKKALQMEGKDRAMHLPMPLFALNMMVRYNRVECLSHPVCTAFLRMKWLGYGCQIHMLNLLIYLVFLGSLTAFITTSDGFMHHSENTVTNVTTENSTELVEDDSGGWVNDKHQTHHGAYQEEVKLTGGQKGLVAVVLTFCILNVIKEITQMFQQKTSYFQDITNLWEWILYITAGMFIAPFCVGYNSSAQWQCAAIAIFLAWFNLLIFLQRFDFFGIYVVMFLEILKTLVQVLLVFSILIVAFALTFYILFFSVEVSIGHDKPIISMVTTIVMMTGTIEYVDNWLDPYATGDLMFQTLTFMMLVVFILLVPILLVNLLIGLAVGDIEAIQRDAILKRIAMQVQYNTELEEKLPSFILRRVDKPEWKVYPNSHKYLVVQIWNKLTRTRGVNNKADVDLGEEVLAVDSMEMEHQSYMYEEMSRQRRKLKQISNDLNKQYELIRLIVQKMEIRTEQDMFDDDAGGEERNVRQGHAIKGIGWSSKVIRHDLLKQSTVISKWKTSVDGKQ